MNTQPIGILSGTFDPIHLGHLHLIQTVYQRCQLKQIILVPTYQSPFKQTPLVEPKHRLKMILLATEKLSYVTIDDYEIVKPQLSYTVKTLQHLRQKYPGHPLALIMGDDLFASFDQWYKWQKILELAHLIVANRTIHQQPNLKPAIANLAHRETCFPAELQKKFAGLIYYIKFKPLNISATKIRELRKQHQAIGHLVPEPVEPYIKQNKLYLKI